MNAEALPASRSVGRYSLVRLLGRGATSEVYEATDDDGEAVALKQLIVPSDRAERAQQRFAREAAIVSCLDHPHVARLVESGAGDVGPWLAFELVRGPSLSQWLAKRGPQAARDVLGLMLPVIAAVNHAHALGVVHRDLKPANVVVEEGGSEPNPKVIDFGVSKMIDAVGDLVTCEGALVGTPAYMAPEQRRDARSADGRSDQYALGLMMYELATGTLPSYATADGDGAYESPRAPSLVRPGLGDELDAIILRAIAYDPRDRFPDVASFGRALLSLAEGPIWARYAGGFAETDGNATLDAVDSPPRAPPAKQRTMPWLPAALIVTALAASVVVFRQQRPPIAASAPAATTPFVAAVAEPALHTPSVPAAPQSAVAIAPSASASVVVVMNKHIRGPSKAPVVVPAQASAPAPAPAPVTPVEIGDNGAAILH